ncbi:MAG: T9SS type B sorting domain-containing protein [Bacteroidia bacterium]
MIRTLHVFFFLPLCLQGAFGQTAPGSGNDSILHFRTVGIPLEIKVACEDQKYQIAWFLDQLDSTAIPERLYFKGYRFDEGDNSRIDYHTQTLDSEQLYQTPFIWISSPGYYWVEYRDTVNKIHYSSDEVHVELCSRFQLADRFVIETGKFYKPVYSQNIDHIELVIFDSQGIEVFSSKNANFKWDGRNMQTLEPCAPGSYFYYCDVYEIRGGEIAKRNITGIIEITH